MMRRLIRAIVRNATASAGEGLTRGLTLRLDPVILNAANILSLEEVEVVNHFSGERLVTFAEAGAPGEASAPRVRAGDTISILSWGLLHDGQTLAHRATIVTLDGENRVVAVEAAAIEE
jgi:aspartate 1-decarboxylase